MSAKYETLLEIKAVTDHDCGNYEIGEVDFSAHCKSLDNYLKAYGYKGKKEILAMLGFLSYYVHNEYINMKGD
jgi:hypothetical protein